MSAELRLPPGFRFHPTDDELVMHYLCRKCASQPIAAPIIADIDLYKYDPWQLPELAPYGEREWYFFSPRDRKYPNGSRPNRSAGTGYWKATGADKPLGQPKPVGIKKALVFYAGKAPRGQKTNWIMHEYRLADADRSARKNSLRLDDWVLCRIYNKKGIIEAFHVSSVQCGDGTAASGLGFASEHEFLGNSTTFRGFEEHACLDLERSESVPKLHGESTCSANVASPACEKEVQSEPRWCWENALDFALSHAVPDDQAAPSHLSPLQDMFMYLPPPL